MRRVESVIRDRLIWCSWLPRKIRRKLAKRLVRKASAHGVIGNNTFDSAFVFTTRINELHYKGTLLDAIDFDIYFYGAFEKPLANLIIY